MTHSSKRAWFVGAAALTLCLAGTPNLLGQQPWPAPPPPPPGAGLPALRFAGVEGDGACFAVIRGAGPERLAIGQLGYQGRFSLTRPWRGDRGEMGCAPVPELPVRGRTKG